MTNHCRNNAILHLDPCVPVGVTGLPGTVNEEGTRRALMIDKLTSPPSFGSELSSASTSSETTFSSAGEASLLMGTPPPSRKRKRVRFDSNNHETTTMDISGGRQDSSLLPQVYVVENLGCMPKHIKKTLWVQEEDIQESVQYIRQSFDHQNVSNNRKLPLYRDTLSKTYMACLECTNKSESIPTAVSPQQLQLLGTSRGDNRGLESCAVPSLAFQRTLKRKNTIQTVVAVHHQLRGIPQEAQLLRLAALDLSRPARKFAQAMGIGDSLAVLAELEELSQPDEASLPLPPLPPQSS